MNIKIINNFLENEDFLNLKNKFLSNTFPYFYNDFKVNENDGSFQFTHLFYTNGKINSPYFNLIEPILIKLKVKSIVRVKLNMTFKEKKIKKNQFHTDVKDPQLDCKTAILYFNTNNGKTVFKNKKEIKSVANKLVLFPTKLEHTGTTHTNTKYRLVLNLNYF
jgi:hypothetical protein